MAIKYWNYSTCNISPKAKIGDGTIIHSHVAIHDNVVIGKNCKIQAFVFIPPGITLEDNVFVGPHVCFTNDKHPNPDKGTWKLEKTLVKNGASIGAGAVILPGITIYENSKIGAGAVVTKNVPANETWIGIPAHKI